MQMRKLGASGIEASVVGIGTWPIGGWMWGGTSRRQALDAIRTGLDAGINFIDTAPIYGFGLAEEIVGEAVTGRRERVVLATKCGLVTGARRGKPKFRSNLLGISDLGHIGIYVNLAPDSIRAEVEASLERLGTDYIDLYQTHWQDEATPIEDTMSVLLKLKDEGKIRAIGVCNASTSQMSEYLEVGELASDQERFSMLDRDIEDDQLPFCRKRDIAVLAYSPLALGLLSGKIGPDRKFGDGDLRTEDPRFSPENREIVTAMIEKFRSISEKYVLSPAQLAVAWTVHQPGITHALCGVRSSDQARENAKAGETSLRLDEVELMNEEIAQLSLVK